MPSKQSRTYCFTLNNPEGSVSIPPQVGYLVYQLEDEGTPHYQGYAEFTKPITIVGIKKLGPDWAKMHLEVRRGTQAEAIAYCEKEGRKEPTVHYGTKIRDGVKRTYDAMIAALQDGEDVSESHLGEYIKHKRAVDEYQREKKRIRPEDLQVPDIILRPWQEDIVALVATEPSPRTIHWYWEPIGNTGKSTFTGYLIKNYGALAIDTTAKERVVRAYAGEPIVVFDITRAEGMEGKVNYSIMETLQRGYAFNTMYDPGQKLFKRPHVLVFSNMEPDRTKLSADRWNVVQIPTNEVALAASAEPAADWSDFAS